MEKLQSHLRFFENNVAHHNTLNPSVSKASIGWHIDHSLKVINGVIEALRQSNPDDYVWKFNKTRFIIYTLGRIPRGKVKAPKQVQSLEKITLEDLNVQLETAKKLMITTHNLPAKSNFKHPFFGVLDLKQTHHFLHLHTKHHLKIIEDILKK
jgi:hypothetical protein